MASPTRSWSTGPRYAGSRTNAASEGYRALAELQRRLTARFLEASAKADRMTSVVVGLTVAPLVFTVLLLGLGLAAIAVAVWAELRGA